MNRASPTDDAKRVELKIAKTLAALSRVGRAVTVTVTVDGGKAEA